MCSLTHLEAQITRMRNSDKRDVRGRERRSVSRLLYGGIPCIGSFYHTMCTYKASLPCEFDDGLNTKHAGGNTFLRKNQYGAYREITVVVVKSSYIYSR